MKNLDSRRNKTNSKGITLVALVITIIVILILAGVTIQTLTGNNGLLRKAETAVQSTNDSKEEEKIKLAVAAAQLAGEGTITAKNLNNELRSIFNDNNISVTPIFSGWRYKEYKIDKNGQVDNYNSIVPNEYQQVEYIESTGTQYINTNLNTLEVNKIKFEIFDYISKNLENKIIFGYSGTGKIFLYNGTDIFVGGNEFYSLDKKYYKNNRYDFVIEADNKLKKATVSNDGNKTKQLISFNNSFRDELNIILFGAMITQGGTQIDNCSVGRFKITLDELLVRDFIPCYSTTTVTDVDGIERPKDTIGMYDTITGKFYVNQGSGTFEKGMGI